MAKDISVTLLPSGVVKKVDGNNDLFSQLKEDGVSLNSNCGGCATCALCIVKVVSGEESMNELSFEEKQLLGNTFHITRERLACQLKVSGPITIDIEGHEQKAAVKKPLRRSREEAIAVVDERKKMMKEKNENKPKKLGGGKKPSAFKFDNEDIKE